MWEKKKKALFFFYLIILILNFRSGSWIIIVRDKNMSQSLLHSHSWTLVLLHSGATESCATPSGKIGCNWSGISLEIVLKMFTPTFTFYCHKPSVIKSRTDQLLVGQRWKSKVNATSQNKFLFLATTSKDWDQISRWIGGRIPPCPPSNCGHCRDILRFLVGRVWNIHPYLKHCCRP